MLNQSTMCVNIFISLRTKENSMIPTVKVFLCQCCRPMLELNLANGNIKRRTDVELEPRVLLDNCHRTSVARAEHAVVVLSSS